MAVCSYLFRHKSRLIKYHFIRFSTASSGSAVKVFEDNYNIFLEKKPDPEADIYPPKRIPRGPTDILRALSSTVKKRKDCTAAHYKYEDDPYFIPASNLTKRSFALSKEAGKKAARFFLEKYPELFQINTSVPLIKAFEPPVVYNETDEVTEETLKSCIDTIDVGNAMTVYEMLQKKGINIGKETKQHLLELLCFYNCTVPPRDDYYEERYYTKREYMPKRSWKQNNLAEEVFETMEKDSAAYCTMIEGFAKHYDVQKALKCYEEMQNQNVMGSTDMYNSLLSLVPMIKESGDLRWEYAMDLVKCMNDQGIVPDLFTMNALMMIISRSYRWPKAVSTAMQTLAEMKRLKIEPSLGTYHHLLVIFCRNNNGYQSVLSQIISSIKNKEFHIRHPDDVLFFMTAMDICCRLVRDKDVAYDINSLLEFGNNSMLLGGAVNESIYFRNFLKVLSISEDFGKFMEVYEKYVPNVYTPEPSVMLDILNTLEFLGAVEHLPRMFSDVILFQQSERQEILSTLFRCAANVELQDKDHAFIINSVWKIIEDIDSRNERRSSSPIQWTGSLLGDALKIFLARKDLEKSWHIMQRLKNDESAIIGYPLKDYLLLFCSVFLEERDFNKVQFCIKYVVHTDSPNLLEMKSDLQSIVNSLFEQKVLLDEDRPITDAIIELLPENESATVNVEDEIKTET